MRVLVTGASGLLGINFCLQISQKHDVVGIVHSHSLSNVPFQVMRIDLAYEERARELVLIVKPNLVVNCAAMAYLDQCEQQPQVAKIINTDLPAWLAEECVHNKIQFLHISTDAVFDGRKKSGYTEKDNPNPLSVYARTKLEGERAVRQANPNALIVRVNFYGFSISGARSLAEFFLYNLLAGKQMNGFTDVHFCPLYVHDLSTILMEMVSKGLRGLYHVVSPEMLSKYNFGVRIARIFSLDGSLITPVSVKESDFIAPRALNLILNINKLQSDLDKALPKQEQGLSHLHKHYQKGYATNLKKYTG
jgi:dTDP-4-dehydrorhamnose reductase